MSRSTENATILLLIDRNIEMQKKIAELEKLVDAFRESAKRPVYSTLTEMQIELLAQLLAERIMQIDEKKEYLN